MRVHTSDNSWSIILDKRVVIIGAGFAGLEAAKELGKAGVDTVLIDRTNHHLFQPLLYQVATAALSAAEIAEPVRKILRRHPTVQVLRAEVTDIDLGLRSVQLSDGSRVPFGELVLAAGSGPDYFGHGDWVASAPGLKTIDDAIRIRSRLLLCFEEAEYAASAAERHRLTTFVVIGGGPTGVELAGSIAELARFTLARDFRVLEPAATRIILAEAGPRILSGFDERLAEYSRRRLERLGVEVRTGCMAKNIEDSCVQLNDEVIPCGLAFWAAGVASSPLGRKLRCSVDRSGRVLVNPDLSVPGQKGVFVIGDLAHVVGEDGKPLPALAQVAKQQGRHLGRALAERFRTGAPLPQFVYRGRGNTAIIGRHSAIYEYGSVRLRGWIAWLLWAVVHVYLLVGFQHRLIVSMQWLWRYLTYERGARLITGASQDADHQRKAVCGHNPEIAEEASTTPEKTGRPTASQSEL